MTREKLGREECILLETRPPSKRRLAIMVNDPDRNAICAQLSPILVVRGIEGLARCPLVVHSTSPSPSQHILCMVIAVFLENHKLHYFELPNQNSTCRDSSARSLAFLYHNPTAIPLLVHFTPIRLLENSRQMSSEDECGWPLDILLESEYFSTWLKISRKGESARKQELGRQELLSRGLHQGSQGADDCCPRGSRWRQSQPGGV